MILAEPPSFYIRCNIAVTRAGVCSDISLWCALDAMGKDQAMFSADYPFEPLDAATRFIQPARGSEAERIPEASENAKRMMRIDRPIGRAVQS